MRKHFKKSLSLIAQEIAHGGSGSRQLILSKDDDVAAAMEAMTKGFLAAGAAFDWHKHEGMDEFFVVLKGSGKILFRDDATESYTKDDILYIPAGIEHRIEAEGEEGSEYFFIRIAA